MAKTKKTSKQDLKEVLGGNLEQLTAEEALERLKAARKKFEELGAKAAAERAALEARIAAEHVELEAIVERLEQHVRNLVERMNMELDGPEASEPSVLRRPFVRPNTIPAAILDAMKGSPGRSWSADDLVEAGVEASTTTVISATLARMAKDGRVEKVARGLYKLPRPFVDGAT